MSAQVPTLPRIAYTIAEASGMLGISRWSTYQLLRRGELRAVRIGARQRIPAEELERLVRPPEGEFFNLEKGGACESAGSRDQGAAPRLCAEAPEAHPVAPG